MDEPANSIGASEKGRDPEQGEGSKQVGGAKLLSPTSMTPMEDSPIFSIPKSEVNKPVTSFTI